MTIEWVAWGVFAATCFAAFVGAKALDDRDRELSLASRRSSQPTEGRMSELEISGSRALP